MKFPILYGSFYVQSLLFFGPILCIALPILHKMVPYIYHVICTTMGQSYLHRLFFSFTLWSHIYIIVSYILLWGHLMYTDYCGVLLLYTRWFFIYGVSYILLWVKLMYTDYCRVLLLYIRWSFIYGVSYIHTIMGPSYVCT